MSIFPGKTWREEQGICDRFLRSLRKLKLCTTKFGPHANDIHRAIAKAVTKMKEQAAKERVLKEYNGQRLHK